MDDDAVLPAAFRWSRWPICDGLSLAAPVVQAPLGEYDGARLAAAVSRAGGLGCVSLRRRHDAAGASRLLRRVRARTPRPVLCAFTAPYEPESVLDACLDADAGLFQVFWWNGPRLTPRVKRAGGTIFWQVGTPEQAREAAETGADVLVVQGNEAGGQVRGPFRLADLIIRVREATNLPIVAGGGLADQDDVARVLALGARAAVLGTRFVACRESRAPAAYKARLVRAEASDLFLDTRLDQGDWPCVPSRRVRTAGDENGPAFYAGLGVGKIGSVPPAARIVRALTPPSTIK